MANESRTIHDEFILDKLEERVFHAMIGTKVKQFGLPGLPEHVQEGHRKGYFIYDPIKLSLSGPIIIGGDIATLTVGACSLVGFNPGKEDVRMEVRFGDYQNPESPSHITVAWIRRRSQQPG